MEEILFIEDFNSTYISRTEIKIYSRIFLLDMFMLNLLNLLNLWRNYQESDDVDHEQSDILIRDKY
jgi:hypothetical protein